MDDVQELIVREIPQLRRFALSLTRSSHAADDLVQDALERAIRKRHLWKRHGSIRGWLFRVLYNVFVNQGAQRNRRDRQMDIDEMADAPSVAAVQVKRLEVRDVSAVLGELPEDQRAAIVLTAVEGFSYDEAADILDVPIGTLRSRLFRGRETLRAQCEPDGRRDDDDTTTDTAMPDRRTWLRQVK